MQGIGDGIKIEDEGRFDNLHFSTQILRKKFKKYHLYYNCKNDELKNKITNAYGKMY